MFLHIKTHMGFVFDCKSKYHPVGPPLLWWRSPSWKVENWQILAYAFWIKTWECSFWLHINKSNLVPLERKWLLLSNFCIFVWDLAGMHQRPKNTKWAGKFEMVTYTFPPWHRENALRKLTSIYLCTITNMDSTGADITEEENVWLLTHTPWGRLHCLQLMGTGIHTLTFKV